MPAADDEGKRSTEATSSRGMTDEEARDFVPRNLKADASKGVLEIAGGRVVLIRPMFIVGIQKQLEATIGMSAKGVLYLAGESVGQKTAPLLVEKFREVPSPETGQAVLRQIEDIWSTAGVGRIRIPLFDAERHRMSVVIENGVVPEAYGPAPKPVCHLWAGWAAGVAKALFGGDFLAEETACRAAGAPRCEFTVEPLRLR